MIVFDEPSRAAGQESMLGFAAEPIPVVRVGFVGLGMRGPGAVNRFTHLEGVEIKGLCDLKQENVSKCQPMLERAGMPKAAEYVGEEAYKELCERGQTVNYEDVLREMNERDTQDSSRAIAPAKPAEDAILLDTTSFDFEESVNAILEIIEKKCGGSI